MGTSAFAGMAQRTAAGQSPGDLDAYGNVIPAPPPGYGSTAGISWDATLKRWISNDVTRQSLPGEVINVAGGAWRTGPDGNAQQLGNDGNWYERINGVNTLVTDNSYTTDAAKAVTSALATVAFSLPPTPAPVYTAQATTAIKPVIANPYPINPATQTPLTGSTSDRFLVNGTTVDGTGTVVATQGPAKTGYVVAESAAPTAPALLGLTDPTVQGWQHYLPLIAGAIVVVVLVLKMRK